MFHLGLCVNAILQCADFAAVVVKLYIAVEHSPKAVGIVAIKGQSEVAKTKL